MQPSTFQFKTNISPVGRFRTGKLRIASNACLSRNSLHQRQLLSQNVEGAKNEKNSRRGQHFLSFRRILLSYVARKFEDRHFEILFVNSNVYPMFDWLMSYGLVFLFDFHDIFLYLNQGTCFPQ